TVACLSAEEFTNDYQQAMRERCARNFQERMRSVRLLVLDDLQYLAGKQGTLDELVRTIEAITNDGGVVAVASEQDPKTMDLPDRLRSRLCSGVRLPMAPLGARDRMALVRQLLQEFGCELPEWAIERIAGVATTSVREL